MSGQPAIEILDITDDASFAGLPPCADARFDHRSCDYWEDHVRGSKSARPSWWQAGAPGRPSAARPSPSDNPFAPPSGEPAFNPFASTGGGSSPDPWSSLALVDPSDPAVHPSVNPFAPPPRQESRPGAEAPRKLRLLTRGLGVFGTYAKVLVLDGVPSAYAQFGPLSAYPRAQQIRDLYPALPSAPLPAVITCVATSAPARGLGLGRDLVSAVTRDLADRGFAAVEAYPDLTLQADEASAADTRFWIRCGFRLAIEDERYPVLRMDLG